MTGSTLRTATPPGMWGLVLPGVPPLLVSTFFCTDEIVWIENKIGAKRKFLWWQQVGKRRGSSGHEAEDRGVTPDLLLVHLLSAAAARGRVG